MSELHNHILLYAKHWYGHSNNKMNDLKALIARVCCLYIEHVSDRDVHGILVEMFNEHITNSYDRNDGLKEMLGWELGREDKLIPDRPAESVILGKLAITTVEQIDISAKFNDICFSKVDRETCDNCHRKENCKLRFV